MQSLSKIFWWPLLPEPWTQEIQQRFLNTTLGHYLDNFYVRMQRPLILICKVIFIPIKFHVLLHIRYYFSDCCSALLDTRLTITKFTHSCSSFTLNAQDVKVWVTKAFADSCQLLHLCYPADVAQDIKRDADKATPLLSLSAFTLFLMIVSHNVPSIFTGWQNWKVDTSQRKL